MLSLRMLDRAAAIVSLVLLGTLALFTFYLAELTQKSKRAAPSGSQRSQAPDYFVEKLTLSTMNAQGQPSLRIQAERLQHQPSDDTAAFERPILDSLDPNRPHLSIRADSGRIHPDTNEAQLSGHVLITRAGTGRSAPLQITTDALTVLPDPGILTTDRPITLIQGAHRLSGVGMEFDHQARVVRLQKQVHAIWTPPASLAPAPTGGVPSALPLLSNEHP
jgi:lipopolysaccharide export system protein LptC